MLVLMMLMARLGLCLAFDLSLCFITECFALQSYSIFFISRRNNAIRSSKPTHPGISEMTTAAIETGRADDCEDDCSRLTAVVRAVLSVDDVSRVRDDAALLCEALTRCMVTATGRLSSTV